MDEDGGEMLYEAPLVSGKTGDGSIILKWEKIGSPNLLGYKVVISSGNASPAYTGGEGCSGYLVYITGGHITTVEILPGMGYHGGDLETVEPGLDYYFSVTALYPEGPVPGNVVKLTFPVKKVEEEVKSGPEPEPKPAPKPQPDPEPEPGDEAVIRGKVVDNTIRLDWKEAQNSNFVYYKVAITEKNPNPTYPEDGYLFCIHDRKTTSAVVDNTKKYHGGKEGISYLEPGRTYYFSVTYVFKDRKVTAQAIKLKVPEGMEKPASPVYAAPVIEGEVCSANGSQVMVIRWTWGGSSDEISGFKIYVTESGDDPNGKRSYFYHSHLGKEAREFTFYCCEGSGPVVSPGVYYHFQVYALYQGKAVSSKIVTLKITGSTL